LTKNRGLLDFPDCSIRLIDTAEGGLRFEMAKTFKRAPGTPGTKVDADTEERLRQAVQEKLSNPDLTLRELAKIHNVTYSTLRRRYEDYRNHSA
jgi:hypothetical protein